MTAKIDGRVAEALDLMLRAQVKLDEMQEYGPAAQLQHAIDTLLGRHALPHTDPTDRKIVYPAIGYAIAGCQSQVLSPSCEGGLELAGDQAVG